MDIKSVKKFRIRTLCAFIIIFILTGVSGYFLYTNHLIRHTEGTLQNAINDTEDAINLGVRDFLLRLTYDVAYTDIGDLVCVTNINEKTISAHDDGKFTADDIDEYLQEYADALNYKEINIIDSDGIIIYSNIPEYYGFDMASGTQRNDQAHDFFSNIEEHGYYVQEARGTSYDVNNRMQYAGIRLDRDCYLCKAGSYLQVGFDLNTIQENINYQVPMSAANHRVGESGMIIICTDNASSGGYIPVGVTGVGTHGSNLSAALGGADLNFNPDDYVHDMMCTGVLYGIPCHFMYRHISGYYIIATIPLSEAHATRNLTVIAMLAVEFVSFLLLYLIIFLLTLKLPGGKIKKAAKKDIHV